MNTTYLIGAGASCNSLPLVLQMPERMRFFSLFMKAKIEQKIITHDYRHQFIADLDELIENVSKTKSTSFDAYAFELSNSANLGALKLMKLKALLSSYFMFEQMKKDSKLKEFIEKINRTNFSQDVINKILEPVDPRYRTFWTHFYNKEDRQPKSNTRIISWNYDMQFEYSFANFTNYSIQLTQDTLQTFPSEKKENIDISKFAILKLNGTAGNFKERTSSGLFTYFDYNKEELSDSHLNYLVDIVANNSRRSFLIPNLFFGWENENEMINKARSLAYDIIAKTSELVIIGYSFPHYNKKVDQNILKPIANLRSVTLQTLDKDVDAISSRLKSLGIYNQQIKHIETNLDEFYVKY